MSESKTVASELKTLTIKTNWLQNDITKEVHYDVWATYREDYAKHEMSGEYEFLGTVRKVGSYWRIVYHQTVTEGSGKLLGDRKCLTKTDAVASLVIERWIV